MVLGIDSAEAVASAALVENGRPISEEVSAGARANHAEVLLPMVDALLRRAGVSLSDLSGLAVSIGPGSFTGLRIGLSTVKGLAYGWNLPVAGVPTLLAVAAKVRDWEGLICPFLDARKSEVYAALFNRKGERLERLTEDLVCRPEKIVRLVGCLAISDPCLFIGGGVGPYGELLRQSLGSRAVPTLGERYPSTAFAVARIGEEKLAKGEQDPLGPLIPVYLRPSEAELKLEIRREFS